MFDFNSDKMMNRLFRRVDNVVWDMMSGRIGVRTDDGIVTCEIDKDEPESSQININMMDQFAMSMPAYATSTPKDSINVGDVIVSNKGKSDRATILGWVVKKTEKSFRLMKIDGTSTGWTPPSVSLMGFDSGVLVLRSLTNMLPNGEAGLGNMQHQMMQMSMMASMMGGDDEEGTSDIMDQMMPMMLMSGMGLNPLTGMQNTDEAAKANPMAAMAPMMQMMMMSKLMGKGSTRSRREGVRVDVDNGNNSDKKFFR